jgi:hypothetical protein
MELRALRALPSPMLLACLAGCSTLEVSDVLVARETGRPRLESSGPDASLSLGFNDTTGFYSVGVFGMPVIPTYVKGESPDLVLEARLTLVHHVDYSFATAPCLETDAAPLCPESVQVIPLLESRAEVQIGADAAAERIAGLPDFSLSAAELRAPARMTSAEVERRISYLGIPPWVSASIDVVYTYRCAAHCPAEFVLALDDFAVAGESFRSHGRYHFQKKRIKDYRGLTEIQ